MALGQPAFVNEFRARLYALMIVDPVERVFVCAALCKTIAFLLSDPVYQRASLPFDLLTHVRAVHASLESRAMLVDILMGRYAHFSELPEKF